MDETEPNNAAAPGTGEGPTEVATTEADQGSAVAAEPPQSDPTPPPDTEPSPLANDLVDRVTALEEHPAVQGHSDLIDRVAALEDATDTGGGGGSLGSRFKAWVRRELELAAGGLSHEERQKENP